MIFYHLQKKKQRKDLLTDVLFAANLLLAPRLRIMNLCQTRVWPLIFAQQLPVAKDTILI